MNPQPPTAETTVGPEAPATQSILCGFFRAYMGLKTEQAVVYNQKWKIPNDDRLYLVVASVGPQRAYSASSTTRVVGEGVNEALVEDVAVGSREILSIDIYSKGQAAVNRKEEILTGLASIQMQQLCERYALKVARIPLTFADLSHVEGTARLNRFQISFAVLRTRVVTKPVEYFDQFKQPSLVIEP